MSKIKIAVLSVLVGQNTTLIQMAIFNRSSYSVAYLLVAGQNGNAYIKMDFANKTATATNNLNLLTANSDANVRWNTSGYYAYANKKYIADVFAVQPDSNGSVSNTTDNFGKFDTTFDINDKFCTWWYANRLSMALFIGIKKFL